MTTLACIDPRDTKREVIQLLSADGWGARYQSDPEHSSITEEKLVCWALLKEATRFQIVGVIVRGRETRFVDLEERFIGYIRTDVRL